MCEPADDAGKIESAGFAAHLVQNVLRTSIRIQHHEHAIVDLGVHLLAAPQHIAGNDVDRMNEIRFLKEFPNLTVRIPDAARDATRATGTVQPVMSQLDVTPCKFLIGLRSRIVHFLITHDDIRTVIQKILVALNVRRQKNFPVLSGKTGHRRQEIFCVAAERDNAPRMRTGKPHAPVDLGPLIRKNLPASDGTALQQARERVTGFVIGGIEMTKEFGIGRIHKGNSRPYSEAGRKSIPRNKKRFDLSSRGAYVSRA